MDTVKNDKIKEYEETHNGWTKKVLQTNFAYYHYITKPEPGQKRNSKLFLLTVVMCFFMAISCGIVFMVTKNTSITIAVSIVLFVVCILAAAL